MRLSNLLRNLNYQTLNVNRSSDGHFLKKINEVIDSIFLWIIDSLKKSTNDKNNRFFDFLILKYKRFITIIFHST